MTTEIIEALSAEEIEDVRALFIEYAESLGWDLSQGGRLADEIADLPGPYAQPAGALLLARVDGERAGVLGLQPVPADARILGIGVERFGELKRLYVRPACRRRGVAEALMLRAEAEGRERGYDRLVLTTSEEMFPLAQGLYDRLGYETTREYRDDMPYPHIRWMRKCL